MGERRSELQICRKSSYSAAETHVEKHSTLFTVLHEAVRGLTMWLMLRGRAGRDAVGNGGESERGRDEHSGFLLALSDLSPGDTPIHERA